MLFLQCLCKRQQVIHQWLQFGAANQLELVKGFPIKLYEIELIASLWYIIRPYRHYGKITHDDEHLKVRIGLFIPFRLCLDPRFAEGICGVKRQGKENKNID